MMWQVVVYLLTFAAVILIAHVCVSIFMERMRRMQEKKLDAATKQLEGMFIEVEKEKLFYLYFISPLICAAIALVASRNVIVGVVAAVAGVFLPTVAINMMNSRRKAKFQRQLVDGIMILSSSLKGGLSLLQAIEVVVEEMPAPFSDEFGLILRENKMGLALDESLRRLALRMDLEEVKLLVNSMLVAKETGGDFTKVLARLTLTIRDNIKLRDTIRTLTLQGRLQGVIMSILPLIFISSVVGFNREHFSIMLETELGRMLLLVAMGLQIVGWILIYKFSKMQI